MPKIGCPCGFTAETDEDFDFDEARKAFDAHACQHHPAVQPHSSKWHESLGAVVFMLVVGAVVTSPCWGLALWLAAK